MYTNCILAVDNGCLSLTACTSAVVVSPSGARKILESFPCHDVGELKCSPAFDFHLSSLVERGLVNAYGMLPEAVWMPKQGELFGIEPVRLCLRIWMTANVQIRMLTEC